MLVETCDRASIQSSVRGAHLSGRNVDLHCNHFIFWKGGWWLASLARGGCGCCRVKDTCHSFPLPTRSGGHPSSWAARGAGGLSWPSAQGTQLQFMSSFVLCPLAFSTVMQKLRNTVPGYLGSSELLDLSYEFEWCVFVYRVPFIAAVFLWSHQWVAVLFCLLNFLFLVLFFPYSGFDPGNKWIAVESGRNGQWKTSVWEKTENDQSKWGWGQEAEMGVSQALEVCSFPSSLPAPCKILSTLRPRGFMVLT